MTPVTLLVVFWPTVVLCCLKFHGEIHDDMMPVAIAEGEGFTVHKLGPSGSSRRECCHSATNLPKISDYQQAPPLNIEYRLLYRRQ